MGRSSTKRAGRTLAVVASWVFVLDGCASQPLVPEPSEAVATYARALKAGDVAAIGAMMSDESRSAVPPEALARMVAEQREELGERGQALLAVSASVKTSARLRYGDGEDVIVEFDQGGFRIASADALPHGARTPAQALDGLRRVLARRSYAGLMRLLTPATRAAIETDLRAIVEGLEHPERLEVRVVGDVATARVTGGHEVKLRRDGGVWRVETFD